MHPPVLRTIVKNEYIMYCYWELQTENLKMKNEKLNNRSVIENIWLNPGNNDNLLFTSYWDGSVSQDFTFSQT